jgi:hypothetical protein
MTMAYPKGPAPALPDRHGGALRLDASACPEGCAECLDVCPTGAISRKKKGPRSLTSAAACSAETAYRPAPTEAITRTNDHRLAVRRREDLILGRTGEEELRLAAALDKKMKSLLGRSLRLRQVSAGGCSACEADINVLGHHRLGPGPLRHPVRGLAGHADGCSSPDP